MIANALEYAFQLAQGKLGKISQSEYQKADQAGLKQICADLTATPAAEAKEIEPPAKEIVTSEIAGIEIMELEDAVKVLWEAKIYAESGMGCTGPIVLVNEKNLEKAQDELKKASYL